MESNIVAFLYYYFLLHSYCCLFSFFFSFFLIHIIKRYEKNTIKKIQNRNAVLNTNWINTFVIFVCHFVSLSKSSRLFMFYYSFIDFFYVSTIIPELSKNSNGQLTQESSILKLQRTRKFGRNRENSRNWRVI